MAVHKHKPRVQAHAGADIRALTRENTPASPIVVALNRQVANSFLLYANYKQYHWQTFGPLFRDLHKLFDKFGEAVLETVDELAERVRMIGQDPPRSVTEMIAEASVKPAGSHATVRAMVDEARANALVVIDELRKAARLADERDDPGTNDVCSRIVQIHEKQEWWLRDILRDGDGLT